MLDVLMEGGKMLLQSFIGGDKKNAGGGTGFATSNKLIEQQSKVFADMSATAKQVAAKNLADASNTKTPKIQDTKYMEEIMSMFDDYLSDPVLTKAIIDQFERNNGSNKAIKVALQDNLSDKNIEPKDPTITLPS